MYILRTVRQIVFIVAQFQLPVPSGVSLALFLCRPPKRTHVVILAVLGVGELPESGRAGKRFGIYRMKNNRVHDFRLVK